MLYFYETSCNHFEYTCDGNVLVNFNFIPGKFTPVNEKSSRVLFFGTHCSFLNSTSDYFDFSVAPTRGHLYKLYRYRCDSVRASFFASRVVNVWNSLPESVVFTSLSAFKRSIRTVDFNQFLKCNIN